MAEETAKVASAYILIRARDAGAREDIRRIGQQYGEDAGKAASVAMSAQMSKDLPNEIRRRQAEFKRAGEQLGTVVGEAAGEKAAKSMGEKLRRAASTITVTASDLGHRFGDTLGDAAGSTASRSLGARLRQASISNPQLLAVGSRLGERLGDRTGQSMATAILAEMRRGLEAGGPKITAAVSDLPRLAIEAGRVGGEAGQAFAQRFAATAGPGLRGSHVAAEFGRHVNADFVKSGVSAAGSFAAGIRAEARGIRDAFTATGSAFRDVYSMYATYGRGVAGQFVAGFKNYAVAGFRLVWDDPRIFAARTYTRAGGDAARRFSSAFGDGVKSVGGGAEKALSSSIAGGIGKGVTIGLKGLAVIGGGAVGLTALGPAITGVAAAAVQLSGALGLLPGAASAALLGAGTLKLGVLGVGDAIAASAKGTKEYDAALKNLAPSARSFVDAIVDQKKELIGLRREVQGSLFKGLGQDVRDLSGRYLPILSSKMTGVAKVFNGAARDLAGFFDTPQTAGQLERILTRDTRALRSMATTLTPITAGLLDIADVGSKFLPGLADKAAGSINNFAASVQRAAQDGSLRKYFQGGIDAVGDLTNVVKGAGRIIGGIFSAGGAASASPLENLANGLGSVAAVVNSPGFQAGLTDLFNAISDGGQKVFAVLPQVGDALVALEPAFASLVRAGGAGLASTLSTAASAATSLAPALNGIGSVLEAIAPHIGPVVLGLIALKGALLGLSTAEKATLFLEALPGRITKVGTSAKAAQAQLVAMRGSLAALGTAAAVVGVAAGADALGDFIGKAYTSKVNSDGLTQSLASLGRTGKLGAEGLKLFTNKGLFGLVSNDADDTTEALHRFETAAGGAFGDSLNQRAGRALNFGQALGQIKAQASQLDPALASLAKADPSAAAAAYGKFIDAGKRGGASIAELTALFPQYSAAAGDAAVATSGTARSLADLQQQVGATASGILGARDAARGYQAAIDQASASAKANGQTLKIGTEAGRQNSEALDAIAAAGIRVAQQFSGDGAGAQAKFRSALQQTRQDLITAGVRFGQTRQQAEAYADSVLKIPPRAITTVSAPGLDSAARRAALYAEAIRAIPRTKETTLFNTIIERKRYETGRGVPRGSMTGGLIDPQFPLRRAWGGMIDPRLGSPRQDNVPLMVSGGEFVMNAWAVKAPGVESLLRYINTANRLPDKLRQVSGYASGGKIASFGAAGMSDLSASQPARIERTVIAQAVAPADPAFARIHPDDLAVLVALANRPINVRLNDGTVAGSVVRNGGYA